MVRGVVHEILLILDMMPSLASTLNQEILQGFQSPKF